MDLQLEGRRALVTGSSRGIGRAVADALAAEGVDVVVCSRTQGECDAVADDLRARHGVRAYGVAADTGDDAAVRRLGDEAERLLGGVDVLVNAAATPNLGTPFPDEALLQEVNVKVAGYLRCVRAVQAGMIERGWGRVINVGGNAHRRTNNVVGSVRNAAVVAMTKNLADELGPFGVNVTVVHPGVTRTESTPALFERQAAAAGVTPLQMEERLAAEVSIGRIVEAREVADVVVFLASPRSVALTGDAVVPSGGVRGAIHY